MTPIEDFAKNVGKYVMKLFVEPWGRDIVRYYRAVVVTPATNGKITVRKPCDTVDRALPYTESAATLKRGDQCLVLVLGDQSNSIVFSDGKMANI